MAMLLDLRCVGHEGQGRCGTVAERAAGVGRGLTH